MLLVGLGACRTVPDDPKYRYDTDTSPLDKATVSSISEDRAVEEIGKTIKELVRNDLTVSAVERVLIDYSAACRRENARLRCTWGKASIRRLPSPIPFTGSERHQHTDVEVSAGTDRLGRLRLDVCVDRYSVRDRDELIAHPRTPMPTCQSFSAAPSPARTIRQK